MDDLGKPGHQVYCMLCRGGVFDDATRIGAGHIVPKGTINFANFQMRIYGCFAEVDYINCAYKSVYKHFKDVVFDVSNPKSKEFTLLQNKLGEIYRRGHPYC